MISRIIKKTIDLSKAQNVDPLDGPLYQLENNGHTFEITCMMGRLPASITGNVSARFLRADNVTVYFTGTLTGNVASVTLPQSCYNVNGRFGLVVFIAGNDITSAVYAVAGSVYRSTSDHIIDPTEEIPSLEELIAKIGDCDDATEAANAAASTANDAAAAAVGNFAPDYANLTFPVEVGTHCTHGGNYYVANTKIDSSEAWTAAHWTQVTAGAEIGDLTSATEEGIPRITETVDYNSTGITEGNGYIKNTGVITGSSDYYYLYFQTTETIKGFPSTSVASAQIAVYSGLPLGSSTLVFFAQKADFPTIDNPITVQAGHYICISKKGTGKSIVWNTVETPLYGKVDPMILSGIDNKITDYRPNRNITSIAHAGYTSGTYAYGYNRLSSVRASYLHGFDGVEFDLKWTSDNVPVCCHESSFTDSVTGETISITGSTYAQLETANYYGEKIATVDEMIAACKTYGMIPVIDKTSDAFTETQWSILFDIIAKYGMKSKCWIEAQSTDRMAHIVPFSSTITCVYDINSSDETTMDNAIAFCNTYAPNNPIVFNCRTTVFTPADIITFNKKLPDRMSIQIYQPDTYTDFNAYLPYASSFLSSFYTVSEVVRYNTGS